MIIAYPAVATAPPYGLALVSSTTGQVGLGSDLRGISPGPKGRLAGRVISSLLTKLGSSEYRPSWGTGFLLDADAGRWRVPSDIQRSFAAALGLVKQQVKAITPATASADEQLQNVTMNSATFVSSVHVSISLTILSQSYDVTQVAYLLGGTA